MMTPEEIDAAFAKVRKALKDEDTPPEQKAVIDAAMLLVREMFDIASRAIAALETIAKN